MSGLPWPSYESIGAPTAPIHCRGLYGSFQCAGGSVGKPNDLTIARCAPTGHSKLLKPACLRHRLQGRNCHGGQETNRTRTSVREAL